MDGRGGHYCLVGRRFRELGEGEEGGAARVNARRTIAQKRRGRKRGQGRRQRRWWSAQPQAKQGNPAGGRGTDPTGGPHLSVAKRERGGEDGPAAGLEPGPVGRPG
jgi:hypothetical protein